MILSAHVISSCFETQSLRKLIRGRATKAKAGQTINPFLLLEKLRRSRAHREEAPRTYFPKPSNQKNHLPNKLVSLFSAKEVLACKPWVKPVGKKREMPETHQSMAGIWFRKESIAQLKIMIIQLSRLWFRVGNWLHFIQVWTMRRHMLKHRTIQSVQFAFSWVI